MSIAIGQLHIRPGQPERNQQAMLAMIASAAASGAELIIFPEQAVSGLLAGNLPRSGAFVFAAQRADAAIAAVATIPVLYGNVGQGWRGLENVVNLAYRGSVRRLNAPRAGSFIPNAYAPFAPGPESSAIFELSINGRKRRCGLRLGDWQGRRFDARGIELLIDLSAAPLFLDAPPAKPPLVDCAYLRINGCGLQSSGKTNYLLAGGSYWYDAEHRLIAQAPLLQEGLYLWDESGGNDIDYWPRQGELLADALVDGTRRFMESINCSRAVIGLSGGIDSALAACVYAEALGAENVYAVSMPSRFNSETTKDLAARLAEALGCPFAVIPVENAANQLIGDVQAAVFRDAAGKEDRISISAAGRENVLARERARILAAVSAAVGGIFTCNGNKAECAVGYATFYGDLAGAFAAQADLWKYQVYEAAEAFQRRYPAAPLAEIAAIRPSAELSEAQAVDKGLGDPLHYPYHDYLLRAWVEQGLDINEALRLYLDGELEQAIGCAPGLTMRLFAGAREFCADLEYWWKMYRGMGVAKRLQAPPLLALSRHPFGEPQGEAQNPPWYGEAYQELKQWAGLV